MYREGAGKLEECIIKDNIIDLHDGYIGIQLRKTDNVIVEKNVIKGKVYYGYQISGSKNRGKIKLDSSNNTFKDTNITKLQIKEPDEYSDLNNNGYTFTGIEEKSKTAYVWLNQFTRENTIDIQNENIIDEGEDNKIIQV
jgi:hypothetical protein